MFMISDDGGGGNVAARLSKWHLGPASVSRQQAPSLIPQHVLYVIGRFLRLLSVYAAHRFLVESDVSVILFVYFSLLGAAVLFFLMQRPWRGKKLSDSQWLISILNGGVYALSLLVWGFALKLCGPIRCILAEYSGALVSALSTLLFGRRGHRAAKVYGIIVMVGALFLLARGWALGPTLQELAGSTRAGTTGSGGATEKETVGLGAMGLAVGAGILAALRRLLARLGKSQQKKRLHAVTAVSSTLFLLPLAVLQLSTGAQVFPASYMGSPWRAYAVTSVFGIVLSFYMDSLAEDRLRIGPSSLKHLAVTAVSVAALELLFHMPFSPLGFLLLTLLLGLGMYWATSVERSKSSAVQGLPGSASAGQSGAGAGGVGGASSSRDQQRRAAAMSLLNSFST